MRNAIQQGTMRDTRTPETASIRSGRARRLPGVPTARVTSPRRGASSVRTFPGRLALLAQSGRSCIRQQFREPFRGEGMR